MYRISVVIPTYNREKTIKRCLDSILCQSYMPVEIIVVDDGSDDNTISIIQKMDISILKIIQQNHRGAQAARNLGILNAIGDYIAFLDSDDEWLPNILERQIEILTKNKDSVVYTDCYTVDDRTLKKKRWKLPCKSGNVYKSLLSHPAPMFQGMLVRKEWLLDMGLLDENVVAYQEWETSIRLAKYHEFVHISEPLFLYHFHSGATISKDVSKGLEGYIYIINKYRKDIKEQIGIAGLYIHIKFMLKLCLYNHKINYIYKIAIWCIKTMLGN